MKQSFEAVLVRQCALTLAGMKPGSLFCFPAPSMEEPRSQTEQWDRRLCPLGLSARVLLERCTHLYMFIGKAINPAHQNPNLPINFNIKMRLVEELSECLKQMGKRIKVSYF